MKTSDTTKINRFIKQLEKSKLPVLDHTIVEIKEKLTHENINFDTLSKIINFDPMCLANFLSCANAYKEKVAPSIEEQIESPKHASMLLGLDNISSCVAQLTPLSQHNDKNVAAKIEQIAYRSLHSAYQAKNIAKLMGGRSADELFVSKSTPNHQARSMTKLIGDRSSDDVFISSLFSSLPELMIWSVNQNKAQKYENLIFQEHKNHEDAQIEIFGFYFNDLLKQLNKVWHFPELFSNAITIDVIDDARKNIICFKLADKLSRVVDFGWYYQEMDDFIDYASIVTHLDQSRLRKTFHKTAVEVAQISSALYHFHLPAKALLHGRGKLPYYPVIIFEDKKTAKIDVSQSNKTNKAYVTPKIEPEVERIKLEAATNIPTLIQLTLNALFEIDGIKHLYLLMLDKNHTQLTVRLEKINDESNDNVGFGQSKHNSSLNRTVSIIGVDNVFSRLIDKPQTVHFNKALLAKTMSLMTEEILSIIPMKPFGAKSFYHKAKPIGLFCIASSDGISDKTYHDFKMVMIRFDQHLTRIT